MLFVGKFDVIGKGGVDCILEDFSDSLDDIFAVLTCVDYPADSFFKELPTAFAFIEASFTVNIEHFLDNSQDFDQ